MLAKAAPHRTLGLGDGLILVPRERVALQGGRLAALLRRPHAQARRLLGERVHGAKLLNGDTGLQMQGCKLVESQ